MNTIRDLQSDRKALSLLLEYVLLSILLIVFTYAILSYTNVTFIKNPTHAALSNQFEDIGNEIATKLVDIALIAPENGNVRVKLFMPYTVGDYDFKAGFVQRGEQYLLEVKSEVLNRTEIIPLSNIALEVLPEGSTFSLSLEHELTYTSKSYTLPTAVALAYPSTVSVNGNVTFDMTYSTGEDQLSFRWEFGDGQSYTGTYNRDDPESSLILHKYTNIGNYTANLTVWDSRGNIDSDSMNITVISSTPDPYVYVDKIVIPESVQPYEDVKITLYLRGGGAVQEPNNISIVHTIDTSGSMDPDIYGDNGYAIYNSTSGLSTPTKWSGTVDVDSSFETLRIDAYSTGKDIDLWVKSPDSDFARAQTFITDGERYEVDNPVTGQWEIAVVADYPTDSDTVTVLVKRYSGGSWYDVETHNFVLTADPEVVTVDLPSVDNLKIDIDSVNGTKELHFWVYDGSLHGRFDEDSPFEDSNAGGSYTVYIVADFPYGTQEFELETYIAKIDAAKIAAKTFNGFLKGGDRVGVVHFNGNPSWSINAWLVQSLTADTDAANATIDSLSAGGYTGMADGIYVAKEELVAHAASGATPVIIILSDGNPNVPYPQSAGIQAALDNASDAKSTQIHGENIVIYTIGFGQDANETLLRQIATGPGYYYYAATTEDLSEIYGQIARDLKERAASNLTITDVLPEGVELVEEPSGANVTYVGGNTVIQWNLTAIRINETWSAGFYVKPLSEGTLETNVYGLSNVTYLPVDSDTYVTDEFPECDVNVEIVTSERAQLR